MNSFNIPVRFTIDTAAVSCEAGLRAVAAGECDCDLSGIEHADSTAVAVLLVWQQAASEKGAPLRLHNIPAKLVSLISVYNATDILMAGQCCTRLSLRKATA